MDSYSALVSRALKSDILVNESVRMTGQEDSSDVKPLPINLVSLDWESKLKSHQSFQKCDFKYSDRKTPSVPANGKHYEYESSNEPCFNVTLIGRCRFAKPFDGQVKQTAPVIFSSSEPLLMIARAMTKDLGPNIRFSDEFKFLFQDCSGMGCYRCSESYSIFRKKGYRIETLRQPCICVTKIFNGQSVLNRFHSQLLEMLPQSFVAIAHLKINARYNYNDLNNEKVYRIGGIITDIVLMTEAILDGVKPAVNLGDLTVVTPASEETRDEPDDNDDAFPNKRFCSESNRKLNSKEGESFGFNNDSFDGLLEKEDSSLFSMENSFCTKKPQVEMSNMSLDYL